MYPDQGFFSRYEFFTGGHRKIRLPRNLVNLGIFSFEIFQTKFKFKIFCAQTNKFRPSFGKYHLSDAVVVAFRQLGPGRGLESCSQHVSLFLRQIEKKVNKKLISCGIRTHDHLQDCTHGDRTTTALKFNA
jgi:hypothetical protein